MVTATINTNRLLNHKDQLADIEQAHSSSVRYNLGID